MREDSGRPDPPVALASTSGTIVGAEGAVALAPVAPPEDRTASRANVTLGPLAGRIALGTLIGATFAIVAAASSGPSILVPRSNMLFPNWEAGPLHLVIPRLITDPQTLGFVFSCVLMAMLVAYAVALAAARSLSMRAIAIAVVALHLILLLSPPMQLTDLFNYLGYARLGALHHLNPYTHTIRQEVFDPVFGFSSWHNLRSPYGPLFIALTYPLALVSLPTRLLGGEAGHGRPGPRLRRRWCGRSRASSAATRGSRWRSWRSTRSSSSTPSRASTTTSSCWCRCWGRSRWCSRAATAPPAPCSCSRWR